MCDCLISFHSKGFPLDKAIQYAQLHNPYVINNLHMQYDIQDRRKVYSILEAEGIEIPRYAVLDRDSPDPKRKYKNTTRYSGNNNTTHILALIDKSFVKRNLINRFSQF